MCLQGPFLRHGKLTIRVFIDKFYVVEQNMKIYCIGHKPILDF